MVADGRLILCNERYVQMYNLSPELTRPGVSLRDLIDHRIKVGSFSGNRDQYIADLLTSIAKGKTITSVREHEGRFIAISNRPMGDGGWVATHEDITEQRVAELQRSSMKELESRRAVIEDAIAGFRERVESVLKSVSDAGQAMQSTAVGLLGSSEQASQRARERGQGLERSLRQRRDRRDRRDRAVGFDRRDQPAAHPRDRGGARLGERGRNRPTSRSRASPTPRRRSATW